MRINTKEDRRDRIKHRIRKRVQGTEARPRLTVFRSVAHVYVQVVDDMTVVNDFVPHIDGAAALRERPFDDFDRANDTCAKTPGLRQNDLHAETPVFCQCLRSEGSGPSPRASYVFGCPTTARAPIVL